MLKIHVPVIAVIVLMVLISYHQTCRAAFVADIQGVPYHVKRSFCNTYGGCSSSKRSLQQQQQSNVVATGEKEPLSSVVDDNTKKDSSAGLVAEILGDLIEYLQTDEKYRQGKYVVMVPKQVVDPSRHVLSSSNQRETNNPGEMQELQLGRLYVKRDD